MENRATSSVLSLPTEIQRVIIACLSKHDLTVCVRVCKTWHDVFIDNIWHTIHLWQTPFQGFDPSMFNKLSSLRDFKASNANKNHDPLSISDGAARMSKEASEVLFTRQIHRIRVLKLAFANLHDLFYQPPLVANTDRGDKERIDESHTLSVGLPDLCLEELCVDFVADPGRYSLSLRNLTSRSIRPLLQVLERAKNLKKLTINLWMLETQSAEDLSHLFEALPSSLERLELEFCPKDTSDGQQDVFPALQTFGALKALRIKSLFTDRQFNLIMGLLEKCPVLAEFDTVEDDTAESPFLEDARLAKILSMGSKG